MNNKFAHNGCIQALGGQVSSAAQGGKPEAVCSASSLDIVINDGLSTQDSFGRWMNSIMVDSPGSIDNTMLESSVSSDHVSSWSPLMENHEASDSGITFKVTDVSPAWAFSTEETKVLVSLDHLSFALVLTMVIFFHNVDKSWFLMYTFDASHLLVC